MITPYPYRKQLPIMDPALYQPGTQLDMSGPSAAGDIISDSLLGPDLAWSSYVEAGDVLTIVDVGGNQSADCLIFSAHNLLERYSASDTISLQNNIYLDTGSILRSNTSAPLMFILDNEIPRQDTIGGACSKESNTLRYGHHTYAHHACRENFLTEGSNYGLDARDLVSNINWFMNVPVETDGSLGIVDGLSAPGKRVALEALQKVLVIISNCPQRNNPCNAFNPTPLRMIISRP